MLKNKPCGYQGYEFGGGYLDSICIEGFLWDADSGGFDGNGDNYLDHGGDLPCPQCNPNEWMAYHREDILEIGADQACLGDKPKVLMYGGYPDPIRSNIDAMRKARRWIKRGWYRGRKERVLDYKIGESRG